MVRAYVEHSLEQALPAAKLYLDGADVPLRAAAEGPLPAVPSARRRGLRHERPGGRRRGDRPRLDARRGARDPRQAELVDQLGRLRRRAGRRFRKRCSRRSATICRSSARIASGARRRTRCASTTARSQADQPIIDRLPHSVDYLCEACATHFAAVQRHLTDWEHSVADLAPARARPRLLHADDVRGPGPDARRAERAARRRPLRRPRQGPRRSRSHRHRLRGRPRAAGARAAGRRRASPRRRARSSSPSATTGARRRCGCCASCGRRACRRRWSSRRAACARR